VDRPTHRDRDRGDHDRAHRGSARRRSRSPEVDAYEADRRKAIADREKNYSKGSVADTLLSPSRRGDYEKDTRSRRDDSMSHYDRERRSREEEREKLYRRRGDPRGSIDELPYGDDRPSTRRRRADSEADSIGSTRVQKVCLPSSHHQALLSINLTSKKEVSKGSYPP
jgi:pre-mRNA-processing factor 40